MSKSIREALKREAAFFFGSPAILWQVFFFYVPLIALLVLSFVTIDRHGTFSGFSPVYFKALFSAPYAWVIMRSLGLAFTNACLCLIIAYPVAYFLAFKAKLLKPFLFFLLVLPFWTNFLLHVFAWFFVLEREGFVNLFLQYLGLISHPLHMLNSTFAIYLMMVYYFLPFMVLPIYSSLERFDNRLIEASYDLGASWWQSTWKVLIPSTRAGVLSGFFLVFVPSFGEFVIPELLGGDKTMYAGNVIQYLVLGEHTGALGSAFTVLSSCALGLAALGCFVLMRHLFARMR